MLEGREIPCLWESSHFNQPGRATQHYKRIWLRLRDRWVEEEHPSLLLCLYSKTERLRVGKSPTYGLFALEAFLSPPVQAGMGSAEDGRAAFLFSKGHCDPGALGHSDCPPLGCRNMGKKRSFFQHFPFVAPGCAVPLPITGQRVSCDLLWCDVLWPHGAGTMHWGCEDNMANMWGHAW